ncbi:MAG TPA: hypothetical protein VNW92_21175 [Polyangiaceae bacterium]|nr:hypothetical protein [Polyangiaceae bacterium]
MSRKIRWFTLAAAFALAHCGGKAELDPVAPGNETAAAPEAGTAGSGGSAGTAECDDSGAPEAGCGGEAGSSPLNQYARLRAGCNRSVTVNRGNIAPIVCFSVK